MDDFSSPFFDTGQSAIQKTSARMGWFIGILFVVALVLLSRSVWLQVVQGSGYLSQAESNRVSERVIQAPRGIFYDKHGKQLVENVSSTDLVFDPTLLPKREDESYLIETLPTLVPSLSPEDVQEALQKARSTQRITVVAKALGHDVVLAIEEAQANVQGARLVSSLVRKYPMGVTLSHVLGYTSAVTSEELSARDSLISTDITGKRGLEKVYDDELRGTHGVSYVEVNAAGRSQIDLGKKEPVASTDIRLTLDSDLQDYIVSLFSTKDSDSNDPQRTNGAAVVMDVATGAIDAIVSYPGFDANVFSQPSLSNAAPAIFKDTRLPLFNRAVEGTYPSGSVIKPFIAAAGLQEGVITEQTTVLSTGGITIGPWHFYDWKAGGHGLTDVKKALAESVNTFFYLLAGGDETHEGLGVETINSYMHKFGWGDITGVDLPSEASGFLPSPEWKEQTFNERWYVGDTYHFGIGQGNVLVTPLQIAASTAGIANGSIWHQPHLRADIEPSTRPLPVDSKNIRIIQEGMRQAVTDGSARSLSTLPVPLAGKTGTAQIGGSEDTHAWFTSFGPYENPSKVVVVLVERGGGGDTDAVPIAKQIWDWLITHDAL